MIEDDPRLTFALTQYGFVFRYAMHLTHHAQDAEDVVQEAYIRFWQQLDRLQERWSNEAGIKTVLRIICRDVWVNELRKRAVRARWNGRMVGEDHEALALPERGHRDVEAEMVCMEMLHTLPVMEQITVVMVLMDGWTYRELSEDLAVPIGTALSWGRTAQKRLREAAA